jgi:phosphinothricin acetyltransferase
MATQRTSGLREQIVYGVRDATLDDLKFVTAIYAHHVVSSTATFELSPPTLRQIKKKYSEIRDSGFPYLVAATDNRVLGYCYATSYRARPAYRFTLEDSVYIAPNNEGMGIGTALLNSLIERVSNASFKTMIAVIGGGDNTASIRLHKKCGFADAATLRSVGFKFGNWVDTVVMQKALQA